MTKASFVYVTYIRTTPEKLWQALTEPEFNRQYWSGAHQETDWKKGSPWKLVFADGRVADSGEIIDIDRPRRLIIKWRNEFFPDIKADGFTRCTFEIEQVDDVTKLTITHEAEVDGPHKLIDGVSKGWPLVMSSLKSLLETGKGLPRTNESPRD